MQALKHAIDVQRSKGASISSDVQPVDWEDVLACLSVANKYSTLKRYTPVRWASFFDCAARIVACLIPIQEVLGEDTLFEGAAVQMAKGLSHELTQFSLPQ